MQIWKCANIKFSETCFMLFDEDKKPFTNANDQTMAYLKSLVAMFKNMDTCSAPTNYIQQYMCCIM